MNNNIEKYRKPLGLSQHRLGKKVGVTRKSINFIETGKVVPNLLTAAKIARALGVSIDELFDLDDLSISIGERKVGCYEKFESSDV